jgi:Zn-dependent protease with chaperone function
MRLIVYVPLLCALALAAGAPAIARRAPPRLGAATLIPAALAAALAVDAALLFLVGARLLDADPLARVLGWRAEAAGPHPVPLPVSVVAAIALCVIAVVALADRRTASAAAARLRALQAHAHAGDLVVLRSPAVVALAVPATRDMPGRILVSEGMLRALDAEERRVLLAHERAHLRHRHDRYRRLARVAAQVNPLVRPALGAVDFLLERWADEDAARTVGSRRVAARALARAAVAEPAADEQLRQAGFAMRSVSGRVNALLATAPPRGSRLALILPMSVGLVAALSAAWAAHDLAHLADLLRGDG